MKTARKERKRITPWQKIKRAWERGGGVRLTVEDVTEIGMDDAVMKRADLDDLGKDDEDE